MTCTYLAKRLRELFSTKTGSYPHEFLCRTNCSACADYQLWLNFYFFQIMHFSLVFNACNFSCPTSNLEFFMRMNFVFQLLALTNFTIFFFKILYSCLFFRIVVLDVLIFLIHCLFFNLKFLSLCQFI